MSPEKTPFWKQTTEESLKSLESSRKGLFQPSVFERQKKYGKNFIVTQKARHWIAILIQQFKGFLVLLLAAAALISFLSGEPLDGFAIVLVLIINALIGFATEWRATKSMQALRKMGETRSRVLRNGRIEQVISEELVPGDILLLQAGDIVTADGRILDSHDLEVDESPLTGESLAIAKDNQIITSPHVPIADRKNMVMRGTFITRGSAEVVISRTGMTTELGKIAELTSQGEDETTPLEESLDRLGRRLVFVTSAIAVLIFLSGWLTGKSALLMLQTSIALAVATVPEGLPIVATLALARGLMVMAEKNALINRLSAVETLGATNVIVTDKTGTLTENKMTVIQAESLDENNLCRVALLCNDAQVVPSEEPIGDPMEVALVSHCANRTEANLPRLDEVPFTAEKKMMATIHRIKDGPYFYAIKGAPESIIEHCSQFSTNGTLGLFDQTQKNFWLNKNDQLANEGLRVLAFAMKESEQLEKKSAYDGLVFLGLLGIRDSARKDVPKAVASCQKAGIRIIMATGDQVGTAKKIAQDVGIKNFHMPPISGYELPDTGVWPAEILNRVDQTAIFSRVNPEQKLRLVEYFQNKGLTVAMTGDGVNDAPALKRADIGVAMGLRGTEVAREASDMILKDDRFASIIVAIKQGRIIFENIRRFVIYLLSCNISEVFIVSLAALLSSQLPITPLQILFLNLITDVFPALALGMGKGDDRVLQRPPRPASEKILETEHWAFIIKYGLLITILVLVTFLGSQHYLKYPLDRSVTLAFLVLGMSQLLHVFNLRDKHQPLFNNDIGKNPYVWLALLICLIFFALALYVPLFSEALDLTPVHVFDALLVLIASSIVLVAPAFKRVILRA